MKEMPPSWNITGCIIEPGGFETEWRNGSMYVLPQHPAYVDPGTPSSQVRAMLSKIPMIGSAEKMGKAIIRLADEPKLPLRVQFGSDSLALIKMKASSTIRDADQWAELSHSTNLDGVDGIKYMEMITAVNQ